MLTAVAGLIGALVIGAWAIVAWGSWRRRAWLMAPLAVMATVLIAAGWPAWSFLATTALAAGAFTELVIGAREGPVLRTGDPDAPLTTERWAAAVAAPFRVAVAEPWDVIVRPQLRRHYLKVFEAEWEVTDRESLLATVEHLWADLRTGHTTDLVVDLRTGVARTRTPDGQPPQEPEGRLLLSPEQVARIREITGADEVDETAVIAGYSWWRSVHLIRLACGGATLDWLSHAETQNLLRRVAGDVQRRYASWRQLAQALHGGYLLWQGDGDSDTGTDRVWAALKVLDSDTTSPWNVLPWDMPLERVPYKSGVPNGTSG